MGISTGEVASFEMMGSTGGMWFGSGSGRGLRKVEGFFEILLVKMLIILWE